jgi:hypothetical protein
MGKSILKKILSKSILIFISCKFFNYKINKLSMSASIQSSWRHWQEQLDCSAALGPATIFEHVV